MTKKYFIPKHLRPLLDPTPSGVAKLLAAWDGLSQETQILILTQLLDASIPTYLFQKIQVKALESVNSYIRYLAAKRFSCTNDDDETRQAIRVRIENDPDPLVQYSWLETQSPFGLPDDALKFWMMPHEGRLAFVRDLRGAGREVAKLIEFGVESLLPRGQITDLQVYEIVADYVQNPIS